MSGTATTPVSAQRIQSPFRTSGMAAKTNADPPCTSGSRSNRPRPGGGKSSLTMSQSLSHAEAHPKHQPITANPIAIGTRSSINWSSSDHCAVHGRKADLTTMTSLRHGPCHATSYARTVEPHDSRRAADGALATRRWRDRLDRDHAVDRLAFEYRRNRRHDYRPYRGGTTNDRIHESNG